MSPLATHESSDRLDHASRSQRIFSGRPFSTGRRVGSTALGLSPEKDCDGRAVFCSLRDRYGRERRRERERPRRSAEHRLDPAAGRFETRGPPSLGGGNQSCTASSLSLFTNE